MLSENLGKLGHTHTYTRILAHLGKWLELGRAVSNQASCARYIRSASYVLALSRRTPACKHVCVRDLRVDMDCARPAQPDLEGCVAVQHAEARRPWLHGLVSASSVLRRGQHGRNGRWRDGLCGAQTVQESMRSLCTPRQGELDRQISCRYAHRRIVIRGHGCAFANN